MAAAYYYVRDNAGGANDFNGSATASSAGRETTARTGAWDTTEANSFGSVADACVATGTPPVAGDFIYVADDHSPSLGAGGNEQYGVVSANASNVMIISIDITDGAASKRGGAETINADIKNATSAHSFVQGMDLTTSGILYVANGSGCELILEDVNWDGTGTGSQIIVQSGDGNTFEMRGGSITSASTSFIMPHPQGGSYSKLNGVVVTATLAEDFFQASGQQGGGTALITNCDFSAWTYTGIQYFCGRFGNAEVFDDHIQIIVQNCRMPAGMDGWVEEAFSHHGMYFLATNSASTSAAAEYQFYQYTLSGVVEDSGDDGTGIHRLESTAFSAGNRVSFKCASTAKCDLGCPLTFAMPTRFADLTAAGENQITVYIAQSNAQANLTTANTWVEVSYPDATNNHQWRAQSSRAADVLSATELTTDGGASDWRNGGSALASYDEYKITVDTSAVNAGAACVPHIKVFCTVPSITFYVDTTVDLS